MTDEELDRILEENPGITKLLRAAFGDKPEDAAGDPTLQALLTKHGLQWIIDDLIRMAGFEAVRIAVKSRKKPSGRKAPIGSPQINDLFFYYAIEFERHGKSVASTCERLARQTPGLNAGTLRNHYNKGKKVLASTDPDMRYVIQRFEKNPRTGAGMANIYFPKKLNRNN